MQFFRFIIILLTGLLTYLSADNGKISSKIYFEYNYQTEDGVSDINEFEVRRAYLTYKRSLNDAFNLKFTADVGRFKNDSLNTALYAYLKNALISWKTDYGQLIFGLQGLNLFSVQEKNWGYRFLEKSAMDKNKFGSSADLGIGYANQFTKNIYLNFMITNGSGYKKPETDVYKKYSALFVYGSKKLNAANKFNLGAIVSCEPYKKTTTENKTIAGMFAGYAGSKFRLGAEFSLFKDSAIDQERYLSSVYGTYRVSALYDVFFRIDQYSKEENENYLITGFVFTPFKSFNIAPNFRSTWGKDSRQNYKINVQYRF